MIFQKIIGYIADISQLPGELFSPSGKSKEITKSRGAIERCTSPKKMILYRECVRHLDLRVQVHPGELWISKQRVHIVLEASKSAGAKGDVPKICGLVHPLHPC